MKTNIMTKREKIKFQKNNNITQEERRKCHKIIHASSIATAAIGAGLAQLPGTDAAAITPIQIGMIVSIGTIFNKNISKSSAGAILIGQIATHTGRAISQVLVGWVPGIGNIINASTAAGLTELIGWSVANEFSKEKKPLQE